MAQAPPYAPALDPLTVLACAARFSDLIRSSTHYGMLLNRKEDVHQSIRRIAEAPDLAAVRVFDRSNALIHQGSGDSLVAAWAYLHGRVADEGGLHHRDLLERAHRRLHRGGAIGQVEAARLLDAVVGRVDLADALLRCLHHFLGQAVRHELVRMVLADQLSVGFLDIRVTGLAGQSELRVVLVQRGHGRTPAGRPLVPGARRAPGSTPGRQHCAENLSRNVQGARHADQHGMLALRQFAAREGGLDQDLQEHLPQVLDFLHVGPVADRLVLDDECRQRHLQ